MGDRVAVMRCGTPLQYAPPKQLSDKPANLFVAAFIHRLTRDEPLPGHRRLRGPIDRAGRSDTRATCRLDRGDCYRPLSRTAHRRRHPPEDLGDAALDGHSSTGQRLRGTVDLVEELGAEKLVHFRIDAERLSASDERLAGAEEEKDVLDAGEIGTAIATVGVARVNSRSEIATNQEAVFAVDTARLHLFDPDEGVTLRRD